MREVRCSREASSYIEDNHNLIPDVWSALFALRDADQPIGLYRQGLYRLETSDHRIYYSWVSKDLKQILVIKPL